MHVQAFPASAATRTTFAVGIRPARHLKHSVERHSCMRERTHELDQKGAQAVSMRRVGPVWLANRFDGAVRYGLSIQNPASSGEGGH